TWRVGEVAPAMFVKVLPLSVLTCHCTVGDGLALAAATRVIWLPVATVCFVGCRVMRGGKFTVRLATFVVAEPALLVKTASNLSPLSAPLAVYLSVVEVAPRMLWKWTPSVATSHCTLGAGEPVAAAVKVATATLVLASTFTVRSAGFVTTAGAE